MMAESRKYQYLFPTKSIILHSQDNLFSNGLCIKALRKVRVTIMALNMLTATPRNRVMANPFTMKAPNVLPNQYRMIQVINVEMLLSRMDGQARRNPSARPASRVRPMSHLFPHAFKNQDIGVHGHADGYDETGDARQGQRYRYQFKNGQ